jgi:hypothetical protein
MTFSYLPGVLTRFFARLSVVVHVKTAGRLPAILLGALFAKGRRTVTSWFRAGKVTDEFRPGYHAICSLGQSIEPQDGFCPSFACREEVLPLLGNDRLVCAIDDSPTSRYGPEVEGAGTHHNPTPGPAGEAFLYGHIWVTLAVLLKHATRACIALPLRGLLYVRQKDIGKVPPERKWAFRTKLQLAVEQLRWMGEWARARFKELWVVADGGYAKKPFLEGAMQEGFVVVSRLRKDAALSSVPGPRPKGKRGRKPTYGDKRISLAMRAGQKQGWEEVECVQYGRKVKKTIKTFLATWRPAGGLIRVVLIKEEEGWVAFFCTKADASVVEILEAAADRGAIEQAFKDLKEVWGAGQQQVRNIDSSVGCFNINLWLFSLTEAWAFHRSDEELSDRSMCPWDKEPRRPSHQDKRKALQRELLHAEIEARLAGRPTKTQIRALVEDLLALAA